MSDHSLPLEPRSGHAMDPREFLVEIELDVARQDADYIDSLKVREAERAKELAVQGMLIRLWRIPGRWANVGLWRADTEAELWKVLDALPLRSIMRITVRPMDVHPNDPRPPSH
jgi:muconolactone delta-isomerase